MYRKFIILLIAVVLFSACTKTQQKNTACGTQVCTALFATVGVHFTDKQGSPMVIQDYTVFNVSSNKLIFSGAPNVDLVPGYYVVASDSNIKDFSSNGDNVKVSATDPATGQIKTVDFKISGGCNCHVAKISGPDTVAFD
jgi:predicted membrane-bound mannosyltransferase